MATADDHHDWHSEEYVAGWLSSDVTRDEERRPVVRELLRGSVAAAVGEVRCALDVGGGYGLVTREVLEAFPDSSVVLHDFSRPMLDRSRAYLGDLADRVRVYEADLRDPGWATELDERFDLVVSALAIHNVRRPAVCAAIYAEIGRRVRLGGGFLDVDFIGTGGEVAESAWTIDARLHALDDAGFVDAEHLWSDGPLAAVLARR